MRWIEDMRSRPVAAHLTNAVAFQIVWFACVWGGGSGYWWLGLVAVLCFALWQVSLSEHRFVDLKLMTIAAILGFILDTGLVRFDLLSYPQHGPFSGMAPVWIIALWVGFALTVNHSLRWLRGKTGLAIVLGALSGPFSYWIGSRAWKAVDFDAELWIVLAVLGISWGIVLPFLVRIAEILERSAQARGRELPPHDPKRSSRQRNTSPSQHSRAA